MDGKRIELLRRQYNQLAPRLNALCDYGRNANPPAEYYEVQRMLDEVKLAMIEISPFNAQRFYITAQKYGRK